VNVVVVTDKFAPHAGGSAVVWGEWCRRWPAASVRVVAPMAPGWRQYDQAQNFSIRRVWYPAAVPKVRMPALWLGLAAGLLWECGRAKPDLIHCGQILETGAYMPWLSRLQRVPYAIHIYGEEVAVYATSRSEPRSSPPSAGTVGI
jgi:hypothetical protein